MTIRIWHQSFTVLSDLGAYDQALRAHFRNVARPDTEIHLHGMQPGTYRSNYSQLSDWGHKRNPVV